MRRIDIIGIGFGIFLAGGAAFLLLQFAGFDRATAGIWSQALLIVGLLGWVATYLFRVSTKNMTYNQQVKDYEEAVMQKRLEEMTPEEIETLQGEIQQD